MSAADPARVRLGRIRCLVDTVNCMKKGVTLPKPICFVPKELNFELSEAKEPLNVHEERKTTSKVVDRLPEGKTTKFTTAGLPVFDDEGGWVKMVTPYKGWVLVQPSKKTIKGKIKQLSASTPDKKAGDLKEAVNWLKVVERVCALQIVRSQSFPNLDEEVSTRLQTPPPGWNLEADEELAQYLIKFSGASDTGVGVHGNEHFSRIEASSEESEIPNMLTPNTEDEYWESDGSQGVHWLRFHMKAGTVIKTFSLHVDPDDGSYLPRRIIVKAGSQGDLSTIVTRNFGVSDYEKRDLQLFLTPLTVSYEVIEVHIRSCYQGIDSHSYIICIPVRFHTGRAGIGVPTPSISR